MQTWIRKDDETECEDQLVGIRLGIYGVNLDQWSFFLEAEF